jgi:CDP-6-deoxy-D-xylo-4-hexulose-3-dehydrase
MQGFLGKLQLAKLEEANERRRQTYAYVRNNVSSNPNISLPNQDTSAFAIPVLCKNKEILEECIEKCKILGIETRPMVAGNMAKQPFFSEYTDGRSLLGADYVHHYGFYMPNHPDITDEERNDLCDAISV